jgi:Tol biopolymer transport system component
MRCVLPLRSGSIALLAGWLLAAAAWPAAVDAQYFRFGKNKVQYESYEWYYVQSTHFDVYYYEGGYDLANYTAKAAEAAYAQLTDLFQYEISDRIPILVYQSHNEFSVTNAFDLPSYAEGIGGVTELFKNRVAVPFVGDYRDYRRVLHHELVHAVINDMFYGGSVQSILQNNIQLQIPLWFNEGLAEYAALGWDTQSDMWVREAVLGNDLAPILYLDGYFAYRGGQSVWDYIAEQYGEEKIGEILQRVRTSRSIENGFRRATGLTLEELSERWQNALREIYFPEVAARENVEAIANALVTDEDGYYNTSPAISPQGDQVAYITTKGALFDVYLVNTDDGKITGKLIEGQNSTEFESLRILTPGLSWSPDGRQIAVAVKNGPTDAIALVDVETRRTVSYRIPDIDQVVSVAWSPKGDAIAFEGSRDHQSDIYVLNLTTLETVNYTNDLFSDHEPAWSPDGSALIFHSDRGAYTELGNHHAENFSMAEHDYGQFDLYLFRLGSAGLERLTFDEIWDERNARFGSDPGKVMFISDRNGINNLYEKDLATGAERPLTDVSIGIMQASLSADGRRAALVSLRNGVPSIYLMRNPFERQKDSDILAPNVWARRVTQDVLPEAPALAVASPLVLQNNPLMRDANDGIAYARTRDRSPFANRFPLFAGIDGGSSMEAGSRPDEDPGSTEPDTSAYGSVSINFRDYVFSEAFDRERSEEDDEFEDRFSPVDNIDENGNYKEKPYKLSFSSDLVYGTAGYDMLYGVQGVTQMMFSDMLGNHQIFVATNLLIDLRNSDYIVAYNYLPRRVDWSFSGFHMSRLLQDYTRQTYFQYRQYGATLSATYPIDKFRRVDADVSLLGVSQADVADPSLRPAAWRLLYPSVTYTKDVSTPGLLYPVGGHRFAVSLSGSPGNFAGEQIRFLTLLGDARAYTSFGSGRYAVAVRASGGASLGSNQQLFYSSGVQNWINPRFDSTNGFPISNLSDFLFATPVMPLRGYNVNAQNGSYFALINSEFRFPLVAALLPGPIPILPLYQIQGVAFVDVGTVWGGRGDDERLNVFRRDELDRKVFDDLLIGAGFGLRTILLGYPIRFEYAWPFDGRRFGEAHTYFSIGFDF